MLPISHEFVLGMGMVADLSLGASLVEPWHGKPM